jgi:precorrin-3B C17-methyltransferase
LTFGGGSLFVVGIGPGHWSLLTHQAAQILADRDCIIGYEAYVNQVRAWLPGANYISSPISHERQRAEEAVDRALEGQRVALISGGDAGIYGMASLALEVVESRNASNLIVGVIPGITAATAASALVGAPLGHDFAAVSLSDLLTPWETIRARLEAAASADFVTVLYNPASTRRRWQLREALEVFRRYRLPETPVGHVRAAYRVHEQIQISTLADFKPEAATMLSTIVIGNSTTRTWSEFMITPRGYSPPNTK